MLRPRALQKGDLVAIAAPAGPFDKIELMFAVRRLKELGFDITFRKDIFSRNGYLAGSDKRRADELNQFFADTDVKAVFFARGGYGTQRVLPLLDLEALRACPKIIVGYSDITALHMHLYHHGIGGSFYGPTIARHFRHAHKRTIGILMDSVMNGVSGGRITTTGAKAHKTGSAEGPLVGGCLSLVTSSIGTPYDLSTEGSILFLEDVGEPVYKYDRMINHLKAAGKLRDVKGIIFGSMGLSKGERPASLKRMLNETLADFPGPIITDFPSGHFELKRLFVTLPLGIRIRLTTEPVTLEMLERPLI